MELRRYAAVLRRHVVLVVACTVVGAVVGWVVAPRATRYAATAEIYVGTRDLTAPSGVPGEVQTVDSVITTFTDMLHSEPIAAAAVAATGSSLSPTQLLAESTAAVVPSTQLIDVTVVDRSPTRAAELANAMATAFTTDAARFDPATTGQPGSLPVLPAYVFARATAPRAPIPNGMARDVALGGVFGLLVGAAAAFLLEYLDLTVKSPLEAEQRLELPVLGVIPARPRRG
jgi:capsular polysaccharide biosynthesis protein